MREEGLEPSHLTVYAPQTYVSAIPPPAQICKSPQNFSCPALTLDEPPNLK